MECLRPALSGLVGDQDRIRNLPSQTRSLKRGARFSKGEPGGSSSVSLNRWGRPPGLPASEASLIRRAGQEACPTIEQNQQLQPWVTGERAGVSFSSSAAPWAKAHGSTLKRAP